MSRKRVKTNKIAAKAALTAPVASNGEDSAILRGPGRAGISDPSLGKPLKKDDTLQWIQVTQRRGSGGREAAAGRASNPDRDRAAGGTR